MLVVAAHMDDEVLGVGGTICRHLEHGDVVDVLFVANRAYDHSYVPELIERERAHTLQAKDVLGYQRAHFAGLDDEQLDDKLAPVIAAVERTVREVRPEIVYVNHRGDANQDHRAVFDATVVACRAIAARADGRIRRLLCYEVLSSTDQAPPFQERGFLPNYYVNVEAHLERKLRAMACYATEVRAFPHPRSLEGIRVLAQMRGMQVGWPAAEAFVVVRDEWA